MKTMKRKIIITYSWKRLGDKEIKPSHIEALEETATDCIRKMMGKGYLCGGLSDHIHMTANDPEDGVEYTGYWEVEKS